MSFRVATYNIHKCKGMDGRVNLPRIAEVIAALDADVVALQECPLAQARAIEERLGEYELHFGEVRRLHGAPYGNATLSRFAVERVTRYGITHGRREPRGVLRTDVEVEGRPVCVFNLHLGTSYLERRGQAEMLLSDAILGDPEIRGARIVAGDFNEWTRGKCSRMMGRRLQTAKEKERGKRTYPGVAPLLDLDHIYFDRELRLLESRTVRNKLSLLASDHLPMVAEFALGSKKETTRL